jgi:hypothetical protein
MCSVKFSFFSTASLKLGKGKGGVEESMSSSLLAILSRFRAGSFQEREKSGLSLGSDPE